MMATIKRIEELEVWQVAFEMMRKIYPQTFQKPINLDFRFRDQIREHLDQTWITWQKVLEEEAGWNSFIFYQLRKEKWKS